MANATVKARQKEQMTWCASMVPVSRMWGPQSTARTAWLDSKDGTVSEDLAIPPPHTLLPGDVTARAAWCVTWLWLEVWCAGHVDNVNIVGLARWCPTENPGWPCPFRCHGNSWLASRQGHQVFLFLFATTVINRKPAGSANQSTPFQAVVFQIPIKKFQLLILDIPIFVIMTDITVCKYAFYNSWSVIALRYVIYTWIFSYDQNIT